MDIVSVAKIMLRRWWVTVPVLAMGLLLVVQTVQNPETEYTADGAVIVVAPVERRVPQPGDLANPIDSVGAERTLANLVAQNLRASQVRAQIAAVGATGAYEVIPSRDNSVVEVVATASTAEVAEATVDAVVERSATMTSEIQTRLEAPEDTHYHAVPARPTGQATGTVVGANRRIGLIVVGSGLLAAAVAVAVDAAATVRRRRQVDRVEAPDGAAAEPAPGQSQGLDRTGGQPHLDEMSTGSRAVRYVTGRGSGEPRGEAGR